jgi:glycosyltransferase involved in cell wall biosynthesis
MSKGDKSKLVYITAGAGGMYCGSCLHDNALAKALTKTEWDVQLIPFYTPIRTDEQDVSVDQVFFGGINVYLQQKVPLFRFLPRFLDRFLDNPKLIRKVTSRAIDTNAATLGELTLSVLKGAAGNQRKEVRRIVDWLVNSARPDVIIVSNMLVAGFVPELKRVCNIPTLITLQGDDVFLNGLPPAYREKCLAQIQQLGKHVDGYIVHSNAFADRMTNYLGLPRDLMHMTPLGLDTTDFEGLAPRETSSSRPFTVGYLARLAREKGLHHLVDAFIEFKRMPETRDARLEIAGWLSPESRHYADEQFTRLKQAALGDSYRYWGAVDRNEKLKFLSQIDVLSVPTEQAEPKGLFVLEAMAAGVPVVQPAIGAFPEMIEPSGGGLLVPPADSRRLAEAWRELMNSPEKRAELGSNGRNFVFKQRNAKSMALATIEVLSRVGG